MADKKKDKRKYARYTTSIPVFFYDKHRTKGKIVDISRQGSLIVIESGTPQPLTSLITLRAFLDGKMVLLKENTSPHIDLKELTKESGTAIEDNDRYPNSVKISAKVVRHTKLNGKIAMGIELYALDGNDLVKWTAFLGKVQKNQTVHPFAASEANKKADIEKQVPGYTMRFKSIDYARVFFPDDPKGAFFIKSAVHRESGERINVSMIHPENEVLMHFPAVVVKHGPSPNNESIIGLYFKFEELSPGLKHQINIFLNTVKYK